MAEEQTQTAEPTALEPQGIAAQETDWKAEARKWEARAKENRAKADALEEAQEAAKSSLQDASAEAEKWKSMYEELAAANERRDAIDRAAREYGVDAGILGRMEGDAEDNAKYLKQKAEAAPKYPSVYDGGQQSAPQALTTAQQFANAVSEII